VEALAAEGLLLEERCLSPRPGTPGPRDVDQGHAGERTDRV